MDLRETIMDPGKQQSLLIMESEVVTGYEEH